MAEAQNLGINLDSKSIEILKAVDPTFRDTIINIGLRMVENTEFFNTIIGKSKNTPVEHMTSLSLLDDENKKIESSKTKNIKKEEKPKTSWDSF